MKTGFSKTYMTALLYIGVTMLALLGLLGGVLNVIVEKEGLAVIESSNDILLHEVGYHIGYMHEMNMTLCSMQFNDSEARALVTANKELDLFLPNTVIDRIRKSLVVSGMMDSVILYNGTMDRFYYTDAYLYRIDEEMMDFLRTNREKNVVYTIPRTLAGRKLFSYVMLSRRPEDLSVETAVVLNVNANWMLSNFAVTEASGKGLKLVDENGLVLMDTDGAVGEYELDREMFSRISEGSESNFVQELDGVKTVVSWRRIEGTNWKVISCQPYSALYHMVDNIREKILLTSGLVFLLALLLTPILARLVTYPFLTLIRYVQKNATEGKWERKKERQKEAEFLMDVFETQRKQIHQFADYRENAENSLQKEYLKNILLENGTGIYHPVEKLNGGFCEQFTQGEQIVMALITIAGLKKLDKEDVTERNLIRFVVCNVANELLSQHGKAEVLPMSGGEVVILLGGQDYSRNSFRRVLKEIAENVDKLVSIVISSFAAEMVYEPENLAVVYKQLQELDRYTLIFGTGCVVFAEDVEGQKNRALHYPDDLEEALFTAVHEGKEENAREILRQFLAYLGEGSVESYLACVNKLILSFQADVERLNQHRLIKIRTECDQLLKQLKLLESSDQVRRCLQEMIQNVMEQMTDSVRQKNSKMINGIKAYIEEHYSDKELCGKFLAGKYGISVAYLGMLFKDAAGCGLQEYINKVRLEHAGKLVQQTNFLIGEIMEMCGFEPSSFYRLYKAYFGVSPKEQRMRSRLEIEEREDEQK